QLAREVAVVDVERLATKEPNALPYHGGLARPKLKPLGHVGGWHHDGNVDRLRWRAAVGRVLGHETVHLGPHGLRPELRLWPIEHRLPVAHEVPASATRHDQPFVDKRG